MIFDMFETFDTICMCLLDTHIEKANLQIMFGEQASTEKEAKRIFKRTRISTRTYIQNGHNTNIKRKHKQIVFDEKTNMK
jgi:MinD superfamily P-loop ATPase